MAVGEFVEVSATLEVMEKFFLLFAFESAVRD